MRSIIPILPTELKELLPFGYQYVTGSAERPYWPSLEDVLKTLSSPPKFPFAVYQYSPTAVCITSEPPADPGAAGLLAFAAPAGKRGKLKVEVVGEFHWEPTAELRDVTSPNGGTWYRCETNAVDGTPIWLDTFQIVRVRCATVSNNYVERIKAQKEGEIVRETKQTLTVRYNEPLFELPISEPSRYRRVLALLAMYPIGGWVLVDANNRPERERTIRRRIEEWRKKNA